VLDEDVSSPETRERAKRGDAPRTRTASDETGWHYERVHPERPTRPSGRAGKRAPRPSVTGAGEDELPTGVVDEIAAAVGVKQAKRVTDRLAVATRAYARDRYVEAARITKPLAEQVPESAATRELHGLVCYRLGRWRQAITHLEAARTLTGGDPDQIPVLMDCHRAMGHHRRVGDLWDELRAASPPADVLVEGRLVRAESLAESGDLQGAIALLSDAGAARSLRRPAERHVRQWFVLADLYERAGDVPMARTLFARVVAADPELADAAERLRALGAPRRTSRSRASGSRSSGSRTSGSPASRSRGASGAKRPR
jgi:tetratricopeptide (TPR) repeat protein